MPTLISVCIPVYNAASSIKACVQSILAQSFQDFEIVLVNDGSTDDSLIVCQQLAEEFPRITLVSTANQGCTRARGTAVAHSSGTWVTFVDSDDTLPSTALADLFDGCSEKTDIVVGCQYETDYPPYYIGIRRWREMLIHSDVIFCLPTARLFRRDILSEEVFFLRTRVKAGTDMPMNVKIAFRTQKDVHLINKKVYQYYEHPDSLSHSAKWSIQKISDLYEEVVYSIPQGRENEFMSPLIQNRLIAMKNRYLQGAWRGESVRDNPYVIQLQKDIRETDYRLTVLQKMCVYHPDSLLTAVLFIGRHKAAVAIRVLSNLFRRK